MSSLDASPPVGTETALEIGPRTEDDLLELFGLAKGVFGSRPGWSDQAVLDSLAEDIVFVAKEHGLAAGYVALRRSQGTTVVEQLFVAPGHERRGIGRRLLAYAEGYAIAEHMQTLQVVVERDNGPARSFYRRSGFVPVDAEIFELVLPRSH